MEFTGERYIPNPDQPSYDSPALYVQMKFEHWHRYALSLPYVSGKQVLDIASGEGYGSALLAGQAASVTGVDIAPEAIAHASNAYKERKNLKFMQGACEAIPLPDAAVDIVTSFETIEHHDKHEEMLGEIKRVLRPGGLLIMSSPNRAIFRDKLGYISPYHIKELYYDELCDLLHRHFKHVSIFGQKTTAASFVYDLQNAQLDQLPVFSHTETHTRQQLDSLPEPLYFIVICSDAPLPAQSKPVSLYLDSQTDLLQLAMQEKHHPASGQDAIRQSNEVIAELHQKLSTQSEQIRTIMGSRAGRMMQLIWKVRRTLLPRPTTSNKE